MIRNVELTAHSGADGTPDNTLAFVRYALTTEADALEVDVRKNTETGELQLGHDAVHTDAQSLREAFGLLKMHPSMKINCDLKESGLEKEVLKLAAELGIRDRLIFSGTVDPFAIEDADFRREQIYWNIEEQIPGLYERCREDFDYRLIAAEMMCDKMDAAGVDTVNCYYGLVDGEFMKAFLRRGKRISVWTVNDMEKLTWFFNQRVRNITTRRVHNGLRNCKIARRWEIEKKSIFRQEFWWAPVDSATDVRMEFQVPANTDALEVHFHYTPGQESLDEYCKAPVEAAIKTYYGDADPAREPMTVQQQYPIKNLVTVSASRNGEYVGNAHRWDTDQTLLFTTYFASPGFSAPESMEGDWEIQLHLHCIISPKCRGIVEVFAQSYTDKDENFYLDVHQIQTEEGKEQLIEAEKVFYREKLSRDHASIAEGAMHWYPVELHTHTQHSDGDYVVPSMVKRSKELGFSGLALTDHNTKAGLPELLRETAKFNLVPIEGLEWTTYFGHMLVLGEKGYTDWRGVKPADIDEAIASVHRNKGIVGIAHPKSIADPIKTGYRWIFRVEDWSQVDFLEVWSRHDAPLKIQTDGAFAMWDHLLNEGYHITGTSGRDMHKLDYNAYGHTYVGSREKLSEEAVFHAIRHGRICVAMGPLLTVEGFAGGLAAECGDTVPAGELEIRWNVTCDKMRHDYKRDQIIPKRVRLIRNGSEIASEEILSWDCDPEKILKGVFTVQAEKGWIRAELMGDYFGHSDTRIAFTNPFFITEA
ncbi:MAG: CehA/McbA family metallohydrolase [Lachnospiraceae bacterium]|nr:CehA/McbA family metallohydrolase [Lachnospiraceae bacterium]